MCVVNLKKKKRKKGGKMFAQASKGKKGENRNERVRMWPAVLQWFSVNHHDSDKFIIYNPILHYVQRVVMLIAISSTRDSFSRPSIRMI